MKNPNPERANQASKGANQAGLNGSAFLPVAKAIRNDSLSTPSRIRIQCPKSGIVGYLELSTTEPLSLDYVHPLASIEAIKRVSKLPHKAIRNFQPDILAGIVLVGFSHFELIQHHTTAYEANKLLQCISPNRLVRAVHLIDFLTYAKAGLVPHFSLDYDTHKDYTCRSLESCFVKWLEMLEDAIIEVSDLETMMIHSLESGLPITEIHTQLLRQQASLALQRNKHSNELRRLEALESKSEQERNAEFKRRKSQAKEALNELQEASRDLVPQKLVDFLSNLLIGDTLRLIDSTLRAKIISRLEKISLTSAGRLISVIKACTFEIDLFADDALDKAYPIVNPDNILGRPKTIAEILAAKKAAKKGIENVQ